MDTLKGILIIVIFFIVTPFMMALAKLSGLSYSFRYTIATIGILICFAIAYIETKN